MAGIDGVWDCVTKSPMGEQISVLSIQSTGNTFTGTNVSSTAALDIIDGRTDGNVSTWKMEITKPIKMTLEGKVTVTGDKFEGGIKAGVFGTSPITGSRRP